MRRVRVVVALLVLAALAGCGRKSYEDRLAHTIEQLKYERRLKKELMDPPDEKKFKDLALFIRAPKDEAPAKVGQLSVGEGQFDLDASFNDKTDSALHLLARVKMPKKPPTKGAPPPPPPAQRGEFVNDVLGVLVNNNLGTAEGLQAPKFGEEVKRGNRFKRLIFTANDKEVKLYTFKDGNHEVALIFVYSPALKGAIASKIDLCLESFAVGPKASRRYSSGGAPEEEADAAAPVPL